MSAPQQPSRAGAFPLSPRVIIGLVIAVLVVVFIALNRAPTRISFIVFSAETALWVALALAGAAGFVAGLLVARGRSS